ncbi:MAG TPA: DUF3048 domain-containing protein [Candidatus Binatia bacterium]|nr:DUF3048 domain-containing protein [Candidatus Binatia bacterium]
MQGAASPTAAPLVSTPGATAASEVTATAQPEPTTTIPGLIGPDNFAANVNPLTGLVVEDVSRLNRRPLAIKISNYPAVVRPQSGLNSADLVFEHYAEGGVTRFTAVFYANDADPVGSVRSARLIDLEIPKMYDAAFAYSGSSGPVRLMLHDSVFFDRIISPDFGHGGFYRVEDPNKAIEHTLFTDTGRLRAILDERGLNTRPQFHTNMAFLEEAPDGGAPASSIEIRYAGTNAFWRYDPITDGYMRSTDGVAQVDANTGNPLNFKNVIVVGAHHEDTGILEDQVGGGHYSIQIQIWGEGPVSIFRNGQRYEGRWRRESPEDMLTFYDMEGNILPLAPGNSFFQLVPLGFEGLVVTQ